MLNALPALGTALPIIVTKPEAADGPSKGSLVLPSVGSWIKLRNVKAWIVAGQLQVSPDPCCVSLGCTT